MYRIVPYFAVGAKFAFLFHSVDATGVDTALTLIIAPELRGILPISVFSPVVDLDIWTSLSFGYSREMATGTVPSKGTKISSWSDGFSLGWGIGAEYYIIKQIGLGLNFELNKPWYTDICLEAGGTNCQDLNQASKDEIGIQWSFGIGAIFFIPI